MSGFDMVALCALSGWDVVTRRQDQTVRPREMLIAPVIGMGWSATHISAGGERAWLIALGAAMAVILGAVRGGSIILTERDGFAAQRYGTTSWRLWGVLLALSCLLAGTAWSAHVGTGWALNGILLTLGISDLAELGVVIARAHLTGLALAPAKTSPAHRLPRQHAHGRGEHR